MNIYTILVAISSCHLFNYGECTRSVFSQTNYNITANFSQNSTEAINKALDNNESSIYRTAIKEAIHWSPVVYYETDLLLNNINDITPVIDLLNELKPDDILHPKIILSLNYLNKTSGKFLWSRMADVYYDLNSTISDQARNKILNSVVAIAVNFVSPVQWSRQDDCCPSNIDFTTYVKDFTNFHFGKNAIQVGLIYNDQFDSDFQPQSTFPVDFLIYYKEIDFTWDFPIFIDHFSEYMSKALQNSLQNATIFVKSEVVIPKDYLWGPFKSSGNIRGCCDLNAAAYATQKNIKVTQTFIKNLYERAGPIFNDMILSWASISNKRIVLGNNMRNVSREIFMDKNSRSKMIVPFIQIEDSKEDASGIKEKFQKIGENYENILLDEQIWWKLSRFLGDRNDNLHICCKRNISSNTENYVKVFLQFSEETTKNWIYMENLMTNLIDSYANIDNFNLNTIIFTEGILKSSTDIQNFVNSTKSIYKIGCSIEFDRVKSILSRASSGTNKAESYYKHRIQSELCPPVFKLIDVMIWLVPEYEKTGALFNYYSDVFLARKTFLGHFPNITVLIQFSSNSNVNKEVLADLYNVPIVIPSNEI